MIENSFLDHQVVKEFSVSEISHKIKEILETSIGTVRVKGEISGLKIAASGHGYFNLKDNLAVLGCTCWRPVLTRVQFPLEDGIEVVIIGKITAYAGQSRYQLSVEKIELAGVGALMQILKERRQKLEKEGLFDNANKKPIPFMPKKIGVITSITGAVIKDIIHRITDRCPTNVIIWPVTVQGDSAAAEIAAAIEGFNSCEELSRPDVIIVARGGGSIEDLWSFNEEIVVRATANSFIPIISAVGHETDYTLIDLAADVRAPTPTAAAEFAVPVLANLQYGISSYYSRLLSSTNSILNFKQKFLGNYDRILKYPINYVALAEQKIDELEFRLLEALPNLLNFKTANLNRFSITRLNPVKIINYKFLQLNHQSNYLTGVISQVFNNLQHQLNLSNKLLASLDYNNVLKRGFAIIKTDDNRFLSSKLEATNNDKFNIKFFDGELLVKRL